jgi:hypothetical protein
MVGSELVRDRLPRDFYPLGYPSNAEIVECNEGHGFLRFRPDEYGHASWWFANTTFAEPKEEAREPLLLRYLDPSFSQDLRHRQPEIDAALRDVIVPLGHASLRRSERAHADVTRRLLRTLRLPNVRLGRAARRRDSAELRPHDRRNIEQRALPRRRRGARGAAVRGRGRCAAIPRPTRPARALHARINNHPSERGHAVLGYGVVKAIASSDDL